MLSRFRRVTQVTFRTTVHAGVYESVSKSCVFIILAEL